MGSDSIWASFSGDSSVIKFFPLSPIYITLCQKTKNVHPPGSRHFTKTKSRAREHEAPCARLTRAMRVHRVQQTALAPAFYQALITVVGAGCAHERAHRPAGKNLHNFPFGRHVAVQNDFDLHLAPARFLGKHQIPHSRLLWFWKTKKLPEEADFNFKNKNLPSRSVRK